MTQKDAVFSAVTTVIINNNLQFISGTTDAATLLNRTLRAQINTILVTQFRNGEIELSDEAKNKLANESALKAYVSGLVSNWVKKDPRLNGGNTIKTTSTRTVADPQVVALRRLLRTQTDSIKRQEIQGFIDKRLAELN